MSKAKQSEESGSSRGVNRQSGWADNSSSVSATKPNSQPQKGAQSDHYQMFESMGNEGDQTQDSTPGPTIPPQLPEEEPHLFDLNLPPAEEEIPDNLAQSLDISLHLATPQQRPDQNQDQGDGAGSEELSNVVPASEGPTSLQMGIMTSTWTMKEPYRKTVNKNTVNINGESSVGQPVGA